LKNPSEDIPKGTIRAIVLTYITYVGLLWIIGFTSLRCSDPDMNKCPTIADQAWATSVGTDLSLLPEGGLLYNKLIVVAHSLWAPLVYVGVFAATLSSALASIVGAPRILQSLAGKCWLLEHGTLETLELLTSMNNLVWWTTSFF
jgi:solute carrier family 12 sodium/potassium/chloride transporter 2